MEVAQVERLLEANETDWTKKLEAERERFDGVARDLDTVRAELADRIAAEASFALPVELGLGIARTVPLHICRRLRCRALRSQHAPLLSNSSTNLFANARSPD